jgi:hypothetical protein
MCNKSNVHNEVSAAMPVPVPVPARQASPHVSSDGGQGLRTTTQSRKSAPELLQSPAKNGDLGAQMLWQHPTRTHLPQ